jgi:hypothetical protein
MTHLELVSFVENEFRRYWRDAKKVKADCGEDEIWHVWLEFNPSDDAIPELHYTYEIGSDDSWFMFKDDVLGSVITVPFPSDLQ